MDLPRKSGQWTNVKNGRVFHELEFSLQLSDAAVKSDSHWTETGAVHWRRRANKVSAVHAVNNMFINLQDQVI